MSDRSGPTARAHRGVWQPRPAIWRPPAAAAKPGTQACRNGTGDGVRPDGAARRCGAPERRGRPSGSAPDARSWGMSITATVPYTALNTTSRSFRASADHHEEQQRRNRSRPPHRCPLWSTRLYIMSTLVDNSSPENPAAGAEENNSTTAAGAGRATRLSGTRNYFFFTTPSTRIVAMGPRYAAMSLPRYIFGPRSRADLAPVSVNGSAIITSIS